MISRRSVLTALSAAAMAPVKTAPPAFAGGPAVGSQVPGFFRIQVGGIAVTALLDGYLDLAPEIFAGAAQETIANAAARSPQSRPLRGSVNAFVIDTGSRRVIVDAGGPTSFAPSLGRFSDNLASAGIDPASVDEIIVTHLHIDHIGGLTSAHVPTFPNAGLTLSETEHGFWMSPGLLDGASDEFRPFVSAAQNAVAAFGNRLNIVASDADLGGGLSLLPLPGHTPGMIGVQISDGADLLLMWADLVISPALQFAHPEWSAAFDVDADEAVATRRRVLDMTAADRIPVIGSHLPFPGHGFVTRAESAYRYEPADWQFHD